MPNNKLGKRGRRQKTVNEEKFIERLIKISRVSKVTKGGKKLSFQAIVIIGNGKGKVGVGIGKASDVINAVQKAKNDGIKNLINVPITKSLSIPHNVVGNFGACKIIMRPSVEGSGVIAGSSIRTVLEVAGIKNVIAKQLGSNNLLNNAKASINALNALTTKSHILKKRCLNI
uniref:Small ribosomal subunit protein uS5c n=1 Tax=Toxarium undulatum TaxID=210620 RepID=A0A1D8D9Q1_9STRA|nr:ribosomal protein S5 [Toxarium undulatum]AOS86662.1 ribosomal protein S5 [Toxarium undulatum]